MTDEVFELKSGEVVISDPCYKEATFNQARLSNIRKGTWIAGELQMDGRAWLEIRHRDIIMKTPRLKWEEIDGDLASDSGLLGIFDIFEFKPGNAAWLRKCCESTKECKIGLLPKGCVINTVAHEGYEFHLARDPRSRDVYALRIAL